MSRNAASSRARPFNRQVEAVLNDPFVPTSFASEQPGMQGGDDIEDVDQAQEIWLKARDAAIEQARALADLGVHKSLVNRLLEPYMWHDVVVSATESGWINFFAQRCSPLAQPEMQEVANAIREAMIQSKPRRIATGEWHTPYIQPDEMELPLQVRMQLSVARCAAVSYRSFDGVVDREKDLARYEKLISANPPHLSPFEHVAKPSLTSRVGNFVGWEQLRESIHYIPDASLAFAEPRSA
jgi:thymidylate synthase ThyX